MKFSEINTVDKMLQYQKAVLGRTGGKGSNEVYLYHYTSVNAVQNILDKKAIWLSSTKGMNDIFEWKMIKDAKLDNRLFYFCCSLVPDNISLWNMYCGKKDGIMIAIPYSYARRMLENISNISSSDCRVELTSSYWNSVCYYSGKTKKETYELQCASVRNYNFSNPRKQKEFSGFLKSSGWANETEVRLSVVTKEKMDENHLVLDLPIGFESECKFYTSPFMSEKKIKDSIGILHSVSDLAEISYSKYYGEVRLKK